MPPIWNNTAFAPFRVRAKIFWFPCILNSISRRDEKNLKILFVVIFFRPKSSPRDEENQFFFRICLFIWVEFQPMKLKAGKRLGSKGPRKMVTWAVYWTGRKLLTSGEKRPKNAVPTTSEVGSNIPRYSLVRKFLPGEMLRRKVPPRPIENYQATSVWEGVQLNFRMKRKRGCSRRWHQWFL